MFDVIYIKIVVVFYLFFLCDWFVVLIVSFVMLFMGQLWNSQLLCLFRN